MCSAQKVNVITVASVTSVASQEKKVPEEEGLSPEPELTQAICHPSAKYVLPSVRTDHAPCDAYERTGEQVSAEQNNQAPANRSEVGVKPKEVRPNSSQARKSIWRRISESLNRAPSRQIDFRAWLELGLSWVLLLLALAWSPRPRPRVDLTPDREEKPKSGGRCGPLKRRRTW